MIGGEDAVRAALKGRISRGEVRKRIAAAAGISQPALSGALNGKRAIPRTLARELGFELAYVRKAPAYEWPIVIEGE